MLKPTIFHRRTANERLSDAAALPEAKQLAGGLWYDGEIAICFSDSNLGKTAFAVQIADAIASGRPIDGVTHEPTEPQAVLYIDCEMSDRQFARRYSGHTFADNFHLLTLNAADYTISDWSRRFVRDIETEIELTGANIVVIDNITYIHNELDKGRNAAPLLKELKVLKERHNASLLVLAHTPKRDLVRPITQNDLAGSKAIMNFTDSCFAIGRSVDDETLRYVLQIKDRNDEKRFHAGNVLLYRPTKTNGFLRFDHIGEGTEALCLSTNRSRDEIVERVREMHNRGLSNRVIASQIGVSHTTVNEIVKNL